MRAAELRAPVTGTVTPGRGARGSAERRRQPTSSWHRDWRVRSVVEQDRGRRALLALGRDDDRVRACTQLRGDVDRRTLARLEPLLLELLVPVDLQLDRLQPGVAVEDRHEVKGRGNERER